MSARPGDCPHCGAIRPLAGEIEHAWDCTHGDAYLLRAANEPLPGAPWVEPADLLPVARRIEAGWAKRSSRGSATWL